MLRFFLAKLFFLKKLGSVRNSGTRLFPNKGYADTPHPRMKDAECAEENEKQNIFFWEFFFSRVMGDNSSKTVVILSEKKSKEKSINN